MYNEESVARAVVIDVIARLQSLRMNAIVVIVDDGSTDSTAEILKTFSQVIVLTHCKRLGVGGALATVLEFCRVNGSAYMLWHVGNAKVSFSDSLKVLQPVLDCEASYAHGSRFANGGLAKKTPLMRLIALYIGNSVIGRMVPSAPNDISCGIRAIDLGVWDHKYNSILKSLGYGAEQYLTISAIKNSLRIAQVGITVCYSDDRPKSHFKFWHSIQLLSPWLKLYLLKGTSENTCSTLGSTRRSRSHDGLVLDEVERR
ncbi:MAG: glycosyltransferase [Fimbriimonas sp.]